ncbi:unnamed protein product, partial [Owenia fusiformis]
GMSAKLICGVGVLVVAVLAVLEMTDDPIITSKRIVLNQNKIEVFRFISDLRNYAMWYPGLSSFQPVDAKAMGIGKHFIETIQLPLIGDWNYDNIVLNYELPNHISFMSDSWLKFVVKMSIVRDNGKTKLTYQLSSRHRSYLFYVTMPVMSFIYGQKTTQGLITMRSILSATQGN